MSGNFFLLIIILLVLIGINAQPVKVYLRSLLHKGYVVYQQWRAAKGEKIVKYFLPMFAILTISAFPSIFALSMNLSLSFLFSVASPFMVKWFIQKSGMSDRFTPSRSGKTVKLLIVLTLIVGATVGLYMQANLLLKMLQTVALAGELAGGAIVIFFGAIGLIVFLIYGLVLTFILTRVIVKITRL
jgi:hypothetical protein